MPALHIYPYYFDISKLYKTGNFSLCGRQKRSIILYELLHSDTRGDEDGNLHGRRIGSIS